MTNATANVPTLHVNRRYIPFLQSFPKRRRRVAGDPTRWRIISDRRVSAARRNAFFGSFCYRRRSRVSSAIDTIRPDDRRTESD